ncbi:MAG: DNA-directed RNA polymerase subunit H [Nanoarchaeota archaeon]
MKNIDVTKHILVPKHIVVSEKEKKELLEKYKISIAELPKILKTDAAIKPLNAKAGDVVKIVRNSPTAGESLFYRVVVNV